MAAVTDDLDHMPVVRDLADFDQRSGNRLEGLVFNNRPAVMIACAIATLVLAWFATPKPTLNASYAAAKPRGWPSPPPGPAGPGVRNSPPDRKTIPRCRARTCSARRSSSA
jgi:hypothetical protein